MPKFQVSNYGRWLFTIVDTDTNLFVRKPEYKDVNFGYVDGKATFVTFKTKKQAQEYIDNVLNKSEGSDEKI